MKNILILFTVLGVGLFAAEKAKADPAIEYKCYKCSTTVVCPWDWWCIPFRSCTQVSCLSIPAPYPSQLQIFTVKMKHLNKF